MSSSDKLPSEHYSAFTIDYGWWLGATCEYYPALLFQLEITSTTIHRRRRHQIFFKEFVPIEFLSKFRFNTKAGSDILVGY